MVLLSAALALLTVLAWQAWRAARERRAVAEGALRDYASFAAVEFARRARDELTSAALFGVLRPALGVDATLPRRRLPPAAILEQRSVRPAPVDLQRAGAIRGTFRLVLADAELTTGRAGLPGEVVSWLAASVPPHAHALQESGRYFGLVSGAPAGEPLVAAFASRYGEGGRVAVVYGFVVAAADLAPVFDAVLAGAPLLPRATAPVPNDSALAVEVRTPAGAPVFGRGAGPGASGAAESLGAQYGGLLARVAVRPEAAGRLVIGGLPRAPLVPLAGSFALGAALLVVALRQLRREAELARLREDFVAGVSHELRTPLAQIRLFAETLRLGRERDAAERRRALDIVHAESQRLSHLVENLLQFSRAGRSAQALAPEALALAPLAAARRVVVRCEVGSGIGVRADRDALRQILLNLLDNTVKHGPAGQSVWVRATAADGLARITVEDQGPGVPAADRERVFERFVRLKSARGSTGAGLGLAVVRELVQRQGGRVWIEEAPEGGARVVVELPGAAP